MISKIICLHPGEYKEKEYNHTVNRPTWFELKVHYAVLRKTSNQKRKIFRENFFLMSKQTKYEKYK